MIELGKASRRKARELSASSRVVSSASFINRPPTAIEDIRRISKATDCISCGYCCKRLPLLPVAGDDPNIMSIVQAIRSKGLPLKSVIYRADNGFDVEFADGCSFLNKQSGGCSIYAVRPEVCRMFPLTYDGKTSVAHEGGFQKIAFLTSSCPPIAELKARGISAVFESDLIVPAREALKDPSRFRIPLKTVEELRTLSAEEVNQNELRFPGFLSDSFSYLMDMLERGKLMKFSSLEGVPPLLVLKSFGVVFPTR